MSARCKGTLEVRGLVRLVATILGATAWISLDPAAAEGPAATLPETPEQAAHYVGPAPVELGLGDADYFVEVLVRQCGIEDRVAVLREEGGFDAAGDGLPAVEEQDFHGF